MLEEFIWTSDTVIFTSQDTWYSEHQPQFQIVMPYVFLAEEDIEMSIVGLQSSETASKLDNLKFIEATLPISKMARPLSSAWAFTNKEEAHFVKGQPHMKLIFSKIFNMSILKVIILLKYFYYFNLLKRAFCLYYLS